MNPLNRRTRTLIATGACVSMTAFALTGCEANTQDASGALTVSAKDDSCTVSSAQAQSGSVTFQVKNDGSMVTEFYLLGDDGLRIVAEKENIAPGSTAELTASLQPGSYFTACKPGLRGPNIGETAFTVTGEPVQLSGEEQQQFDKVVTDYVNFVRNEVDQLQPKVVQFADAYISGDDATARNLYASTRVHYERIEPIAEALGVLDPRIDYREVDYLAEADELKADDPTFTEWLGFHRIEKDLWQPQQGDRNADGTDAFENWKPSTKEDRSRIGETLKADVEKLYETVHNENFIAENQLNISTVSNGASGLLEEVAVSKVTGEEDWWSHYDLWDFKANVEGSRIAFDLVAPIAKAKGEEGQQLVTDVTKEYDDLNAMLDKYGNYDKGFPLYNTVTAQQQAELTAQIDRLREPLSKLTGTVLGLNSDQ